MRRFVAYSLCLLLSLTSARIFAADGIRFRPTSFSKSKHCQLLESSIERIRLRFSWPSSETSLKPEVVYLAVPRSAKIQTRCDQWRLEFVTTKGNRETLVGSRPSATQKQRERINKLFRQSTVSSGQTEFFFHEVRVLRVSVNPDFIAHATTNQRTGDRVLIRQIELTIQFSGGRSDPILPPQQQEFPGGFPSLYRHLLLNYKAVDLYRTRPKAPPPELDPDWAKVIGADGEPGDKAIHRKNVVKILTQKDSLYAVWTSDLHRAGIDPRSVDLSTLSLWSEGQPYPFLIFKPDGNQFGQDTAVVFRAKQTDSPYTRDAVFWLVWGATDLPRRPAESGSIREPVKAEMIRSVTDTLYFEEDHQLGRRSRSRYEWFWKALGRNDDVKLMAPGRSPESPINVSIRLFNRESTRQTVRLSAGNSASTDIIAPGREKIVHLVIAATDAVSSTTLGLALPQATPLDKPLNPLHTKTDEIRRVFLSDYRIEYLRELSMAHGSFDFVSPASGAPMRFDVADCASPVQPTLIAETADGRFINWTDTLQRKRNTAQYTVISSTTDTVFYCFDVRQLDSPEKIVADKATNLHSPSNSADVLVISHAMFIDPVMDPWLQWRRSQGYRVRLIDVQDIYDEWGNGQPSCEAIKDFLTYTLQAWTPPLPQYVLLIGDASWDHRDNQGFGIPDLLPTYAPEETPEAYASDEWYTQISGGPNDLLPEMILGRISIRSTQELKNVIEKILTYEKTPEIGPWRARNIFVNDDTFEQDAMDTTRVSMPAAFENDYVNQIDFPHVTSPYLFHLYNLKEKYCPACTDAIIKMFNRGSLLFQYYGHGGNQMWSHERIFMGTDRKLSEVLLLAENKRLPLLVNWSCLTGYVNFNIPPFHVCLSEELLRQPRKGAIAVWSPSGFGSTEQHKIMAHYLVRNIGLENQTLVGDAIESARMDTSLVSTAENELMQYILFGDPLVRIALPTYTSTLIVKPKRVPCGESVTLAIRGTSAPAFTGTGTVSVLTETCRELGKVTDIRVASGQFSCQAKIQVPQEIEQIRVRFYGISEDGRSDIWGGTILEPALPDLMIQNLTTSITHSLIASATWTIVNRSLIESPPTQCRVCVGPVIERVSIPSLPANATETQSWQGVVKYPSSIAILADPDNTIRESDKENNRATARLIPDSSMPVLALLSDAQIQPKNPSDGTDIRISIPFANLNPSATASVSARLVGLPSGSEQRKFNLKRMMNSRQVWDWPQAPAGNHTLPLALAIGDLPPATVGVLAVSVSDKPDLAFTPGTLRYEPKQPILGQSIYLNTRLYNIGNAPAYNVQIAGYDGPKEKRKWIKQFRNRSYVRPDSISRIEPGDAVDVRIRWDMPGFEGLGPHDVTLVADPKNLIPESDETNNEDQVHLTIHDLPDLTLDPWDDVQFLIPPGVATWGRHIPIRARARNIGDSAAKRVRMSFLFNGDETSYIFPEIKPGMSVETQTALPSYCGKNTLEVQLDRYDLIAEKSETGKGIGNNLSKPKHLYLLMNMPQAPEENGHLLYRIEEETEFSAGIEEFTGWLPDGGLGIPSSLEKQDVRLLPIYVLNPNDFSYAPSRDMWWWLKKHTCFSSPVSKNRDLEFRIPAPNGKYDVSVEIFSKAWAKNATGEFFVRCQNERKFRRIEHHYSGKGYKFQPLGLYHMKDDHFSFILRSSSSPYPTSFYRIRFNRPASQEPVATGYPSALFPAGNFKRKRAIISWDAAIPEGTDLGLRARWWERDPRGKRRPLPWPKLVSGRQGKLEIRGKGDFVQFYALFARYGHHLASPVIRSITVRIDPD